MLHDERDHGKKATHTQQQNLGLSAKVLAVVLGLLANGVGGSLGLVV